MVILQVEEQGCHGSVRMKLPQILTIVLHNKSYHLKYSKIFILIYSDMSHLDREACVTFVCTNSFTLQIGVCPLGKQATIRQFHFPT